MKLNKTGVFRRSRNWPRKKHVSKLRLEKISTTMIGAKQKWSNVTTMTWKTTYQSLTHRMKSQLSCHMHLSSVVHSRTLSKIQKPLKRLSVLLMPAIRQVFAVHGWRMCLKKRKAHFVWYMLYQSRILYLQKCLQVGFITLCSEATLPFP